jgi:RNA 2',3'-cyclic 3'-phosphodiesterase
MESAAPDRLRLFYALWPDDAVRDALTALQAPLRGRLTQRANLHLTLAFLGAQPVSLLPVLQGILQELPYADIPLVIDRSGHFAQRRIAWAGMRLVPPELRMLHGALERLLEQHHIEFDRRPEFKPHVTLARNADAPPEMPDTPIHWRADHAALVQSENENGAVGYRVLASRRLST